MISGLIHVARPAEPEGIEHLADTLSALVAGVAAGLVADAVIVSPTPVEALDTVAEASGARLVHYPRGANPWQAGALAARRDWLLCLEAGDLPREGWIRTVDRFVNTARPDTAVGRLRRSRAGLPARLVALAERVVGVREPRAGDVVRRERLLAQGARPERVAPHFLAARIDRA